MLSSSYINANSSSSVSPHLSSSVRPSFLRSPPLLSPPCSASSSPTFPPIKRLSSLEGDTTAESSRRSPRSKERTSAQIIDLTLPAKALWCLSAVFIDVLGVIIPIRRTATGFSNNTISVRSGAVRSKLKALLAPERLFH